MNFFHLSPIFSDLNFLENKTGKEYYPVGSWKNMDTLRVEGSPDATAPKRLLQKHLPEGGTIVEIMSGNCDYLYEISKIGNWEMHAIDHHASSFKTYDRNTSSGINLYETDIDLLINNNFSKKVDVFMCIDAWGSGLPLKLEQKIELWIWKNFNYILINAKNIIIRYKQGILAYNPYDSVQKQDIIKLESKFINNIKHNAEYIDGYSGKNYKGHGDLENENHWALIKLIK